MAKDGPHRLTVRHRQALDEWVAGEGTITTIARRHHMSREWLSKVIHTPFGQAYSIKQARCLHYERLLEGLQWICKV